MTLARGLRPNRMRLGAILAVSLFLRSPVAHAENQAASASAAGDEAASASAAGDEAASANAVGDEAASAAKLAAEFTDPLTTVPQFFIQDAYTPENYGTDAQANRVIARLIVPRIPRFSLFPFVQLIRPSVSLVTVPTGRGRGTRTEFGDTQLFDLAVLPWPGRETGLTVGVGPVFVFPTATYKTAGQSAWQLGPAFGAIYKGIPGLVFGCLIQNPIAFAYTSQQHRPLSTLSVQPILLQYLGRGFYVKSADSNWMRGWHEGAAMTVPLSLGLGYVWLRKGQPPINLFVSGEWMAYRKDAPVAPQTTVRFGVTVAFPELSPW